MLVSTLNALADYAGQNYLANNIPYLDVPTAHVKISTLYNPSMSYEFYLEPFMVPAVLHLLLCCCVAFAIGQEIKRGTLTQWVNREFLFKAYWLKICCIALFSVSGLGYGCFGWLKFEAGL